MVLGRQARHDPATRSPGIDLYSFRVSESPGSAAPGHLAAQPTSLQEIVDAHTNAWGTRDSGSADVEVARRYPRTRSLAVRSFYHLIGAANPEDERVSVGARALTGEAYMGHVSGTPKSTHFLFTFSLIHHRPGASHVPVPHTPFRAFQGPRHGVPCCAVRLAMPTR